MASPHQIERCLRRSLRYLQQHDIDPRGGWLVGLSGGADSQALWRVACEWAATHEQRVEAAVIDHGLRAEAQSEARRLYRGLRDRGQRCHVIHVRPGDPAQGPEAAARRQRHHALEWIRQQRGLRWLALAHSADDQAETVLMRVLSGTGLRGLAAMRPARGSILRPLLWARREQLRQIAAEQDLEVVHDPHNDDPRFLRSHLRHDLMPTFEHRFGDVVPGLCALAEDAAAATRLSAGILSELQDKQLPTGAIALARSELCALSPWMRGQWLVQALQRLQLGPRRARDSLRRFAQLIPGQRSFALDLHGARVEADAYEVRVTPRT